MAAKSKPPKRYQQFVSAFPALGKAWDTMAEAGREGPMDDRMARLIKLALSGGAMREGAVHSNVRKALDLGISEAELMQVVALASSTLGMPSTVAIFSWIQDELEKRKDQ